MSRILNAHAESLQWIERQTGAYVCMPRCFLYDNPVLLTKGCPLWVGWETSGSVETWSWSDLSVLWVGWETSGSVEIWSWSDLSVLSV